MIFARKQLKTNNIANEFDKIASVILHISNLNQINNNTDSIRVSSIVNIEAKQSQITDSHSSRSSGHHGIKIIL